MPVCFPVKLSAAAPEPKAKRVVLGKFTETSCGKKLEHELFGMMDLKAAVVFRPALSDPSP